jgi:hypothetical protein
MQNTLWRWVGLIVIIAILVNSTRLPWPVVALTLAGTGGYLLYLGWNVWSAGSGGGGGGKRVTYWRGQRIELPSERRSGVPPLRSILPALAYLLIGAALMLGAISVVVNAAGTGTYLY